MINSINLSIFKKNNEYRIRRYNGVFSIISQEKSFEINDSAKVIWSNIGKNRTIEDLSEQFKEQYNMHNYDFIPDIEECIEIFLSKGVINRND